jgi:hypothetical protein
MKLRKRSNATLPAKARQRISQGKLALPLKNIFNAKKL